MEVKDFGKTQVSNEAVSYASYQRTASSIPSVKVASVPDESVEVSVESRDSSGQNDLRTQLNQAINVVNVVSDAEKSLRQLVGSIDGIVDQADSEKSPANRIPVLEEEANSLVSAIKDIAQNTSVGDVKPLNGDKVVLEVREELGRQLELIFPNDAKDAFGMGSIEFSRKEAIIETRTKIAVAWQRIEELGQAVDKNTEDIKTLSASMEVALQNSEASEASPRDLDAAIQLAGQTSLGISQNPTTAMSSVGQIPKKAVNLLE